MEWKPYGHRGRAGRVGEVLTEGTPRCVYCEGTGVVPNTRGSTCQICSGEGTILGAMTGALIMGVLRNGCNLLDISAFWQQIAIGTIIIVAVFSDQYRKHKAGRV